LDSIVDKKAVNEPHLTLSKSALSQITLIAENDFTLKDKSLRIQITGKGCHGFDYSIGFTNHHSDDFKIKIKNGLAVLIDPFTAFYLQKAYLDFQLDVETGDEGFILSAENADHFAGKFWRKDDKKVPPLA